MPVGRNTGLITALALGLASGITAAIVYTVLRRRDRDRRQHLVRTGRDVTVISSVDEYLEYHDRFVEGLQNIRVLGMDCEWNTQDGKRNPVSMLQLCTHSGLCLLIRLHLLHHVPQQLQTILADRRSGYLGFLIHTTVNSSPGVNSILEEADKYTKMRRWYNRRRQLFMERLRHQCGRMCGFTTCIHAQCEDPYARNITYFAVSGFSSDYVYFVKITKLLLSPDIHSIMGLTTMLLTLMKLSLSGLAKNVVDVDMDKSSRVRCSDWEAEELSQSQIDYAALDAIVAVDILTELVINKMSMTDDGSYQTFNRKLAALVQGIVDVDFKETKSQRAKKPKSAADSPRNLAKLEKPSNAYKSRKGPLYENAQLHAPDGQLLCTCSTTKAKWYVEKGIGEYISDDPITVRLLFEPSGRPESSTNYYTMDKSNICVVCGVENSHIRKHIVPKEYRRYFPTLMKEHKSHDVLLLCISCHRRSSIQDGVLRERLAKKCDAPLASGDAKFSVDRDADSVRSSARALLKSRDRIPADRLLVLENRVKNYYQVDEITGDMLESAAKLNALTENESFVPHGVKVVRHVAEHGGLIQFERLWRQHFLDTMQPQFLPDLWTIDHNHEKLKQLDLDLQNHAEMREELFASIDNDGDS